MRHSVALRGPKDSARNTIIVPPLSSVDEYGPRPTTKEEGWSSAGWAKATGTPRPLKTPASFSLAPHHAKLVRVQVDSSLPN